MIYLKNTPNNTGVVAYGDYMDFQELYDAMHEIVGDEGQYPWHETARHRVLGICYDIRHAIMGDRKIEFVDNAMDEDKMKFLGVITHKKNVYLAMHTLWPDMLFVTMALNDFILLRSEKCKYPQIDVTITVVRKFQAAVVECIKETVSDASYAGHRCCRPIRQ